MRPGSRQPLRALALLVLAAIGCSDLPGQQTGEPVPDDWNERLEQLCKELDARRQQLHIPGMALTVVRGDEVVLARGFGLRDIDRRLPATEHTVFAIGSTTKTFTALLLGMLAEEGKIDFDERVSAYLPGFSLADPRASEKVTLRDLLSHRSGLSRMPMVWCAGVVDREAALACMQRAELLRPFRGDCNYSNMNFLAAGVAAARVAGRDWDTLLAERLLRPLGMATASTSIEALRDPERAARGYRWDAANHRFESPRLFDLRTVAPAGAINASVVDMSHYLRMLMSGGASNGVQLVQPETLEELWEPQVLLGLQKQYALGWMVSKWRGRRVVDHGGNVDGFCSVFALLPEERLGFSLLMNVKVAPLQQEAPDLVWEALLGDFTPPNRMAEAELAPFVGSFRDPDSPQRLDTSIRHGRLHTRVGDQPWRQLLWPDETDRWRTRKDGRFWLEFAASENGRIDALTMRQNRRDTTMQRVEAADEQATEPLTPEVRQLLDRMRAAVGADAAGDLAFRLEGTALLPHQGLTGRATLVGSGPERYVQRIDFGDFGYEDQGFDGAAPWSDSSMSAFTEVRGGRRELAGLYVAKFFVDWPVLFRRVEHLSRRTLRGGRAEVLRVTPQQLPPFTAYVDVETARMVRIKGALPIEDLGFHVPFTIDLSDYRQVGSVWLPFRRVFENPILGKQVVQFERATIDVELSEADFARRR